MCGIAGQLNFDRVEPVNADTLRAMCSAIRHRGPDDTGLFLDGPIGLGSMRLSIIDVVGGRMPLSNEDGSIWITYNGEIYNFLKLRRQLEASGHRFTTNTDTETIVHLYEEIGDNFPSKLEGMFALAIWDSNCQKLILARDHVGIKPLYYAVTSSSIIFASEINSLFAAGLEPRVDRIALHDYLSLNYVPGPRTMLAGARKLQPGHLLIVSALTGHIEDRQYWDFPQCSNGETRSIKDTEHELLHLLRDVVSDTMISDVPLGAFLSGGIDSSLVVALMSEASSAPVKTFSIGFAEDSYNELPYARAVARRFRTDHHELVLRPDVTNLVESMTEYFAEPFADNSAVAVYAVSQLAALHVKVVLSGDGGDEVFGGYYTYLADKLAGLYQKLPRQLGAEILPSLVEQLPTSFEKASLDFKLKRFIRAATLPPLEAHVSWKAYLSEAEKEELYGAVDREIRPTTCLFEEYFERYKSGDLINRMLYVDSKVQLPDCMLTKVDRMSMAHSLEARVPMLDQRVVNFMAQLPGDFKVRRLTLKFLLKRIASRILPAEILNRPKSGFTIPIAHWLASDLKEMMMAALSPDKVKTQGFFDYRRIATMIDAHLKGERDLSRALWTLMMFSLWHDRYVAKPVLELAA